MTSAQNHGTAPSDYRRDIDSLRALAIVPVVLFHAGLESLAPGGFVGVDIFFVISGFLITGIIVRDIQAGKFSIAKFYERRARRIMPALTVVILLSLGAGWLMFKPEEVDALAKSTLAAVGFSSNLWFWQSSLDYFGQDVELAPLTHTWSLSVEEQFYIFFPLIVLVLLRIAPKRLGQVILGLTLGSFVLASFAVHWKPSATFYLLPTRAWELGMGALLAVYPIHDYLRNQRLRECAGLAGVVLLAVPIFLYSKWMPFPGYSALLPCLGAFLVIAAGARPGTRTLGFLQSGALVFIGKISYSLYLVHWPLIVFVKYLESTTVIAPLTAALLVAGSALCAVASWRFVETPFRHSSASRSAVFAYSGVAMAAVAVPSLGMLHLDGMKRGLSEPMQAIVKVSGDRPEVPGDCVPLAIGESLCSVGASAGPERSYDFILWGDSHALSISAAISDAAKATGKAGLMTSINCPPLVGAKRLVEPRCTEFTEAVQREVFGRADINTVILHARWAAYETGTLMPGEPGGGALSIAALRDEQDPTGNSSPEVFARAFRRTMEPILASGRQVVVIEGVPEVGWNVPNALLVKARWGIDHPPAPTMHAVRARQAGASAVFDRFRSHPRVRFVKLAPRVCPDDTCLVEVNGLPAYFDDDHVTKTAANAWFYELFVQEVFGQAP